MNKTNNLPTFTLEKIWNDVIGTRSEREVKPRDYIYAGEIGGSVIDTILKMRGEQFTNLPNDRSLRKFFAGDVWEDITKIVLASSGLLINTQEKLEYQYKGLCAVHGRLDHYAGGIPSVTKAEAYFNGMKKLSNDLYDDQNPYESSLENISNRVAQTYLSQFPEGLRKIIIEIKSASAFMFQLRVRRNKPDLHHALQAFHYLKAKGDEMACIDYVNRDDAMIKEFYIFKNNKELEKIYKSKIEEITKWYKSGEMPPLEQEVVWNGDAFKFEKNWKVEYSNYLSLLYTYKEPEDYRERWEKSIASFNRTFKRALQIRMGAKTPTGKPMLLTPANIEVINELTSYFPNFDDLLIKAIEAVKIDPTIAIEETENE